MTLGEGVKNSWSTSATEPPLPHAELLSIGRLAEAVKIPVATVIANLQRNGIAVDSADVTVQQLADRYGVSPQQVYLKTQSADAKPKVSLLQGGGWGRMTVEQVCERAGVPLATGLERLRAAGVEATPSSGLREVGSPLGKSPIDIAKIVAGPDADLGGSDGHTPGAGSGPAGGRPDGGR
jgi:hypothetical protein